MFVEIVEECKEHNVFGIPVRKSKILIEYKVLACLKILGRDLCCDEIDEVLNISESTVNKFFHQFITNFANAVYNKYVYVPDGAELDAVQEVYSRMGFPGCVGSMDCTHLVWDRAAKKVANQCKKSGSAKTLSFEVVVDHFRRIHHVSKYFYGATNDKRVMFNDTYPYDLVHCRVHGDREFITYNSLGQPSKWRGAWIITDNGYTRYMSLQCPDHHATDHDEVMFAEWLESMRKDIECTFGILKQRFRILKNPIRLKFEDDIEGYRMGYYKKINV
jgi:hypothetical protein